MNWQRLNPFRSSQASPKVTIASLQAEIEELREQYSGASYDPDMYLSPEGGGSLFYNRLSLGTRELAPMQQERATELAYLLYESNPLGKSIVETPRDFILGDSMTVTSVDSTELRRKEQQSVIDAFWNDPINLMDIKMSMKVMELGLFGEQCWPVEVNPVNGHVRLGYIDPAHIKAVFTDPRNVERQLAVITYVRLEDKTPEERWWKIINVEEDPNSPWHGRLVGITTKTTSDEPTDDGTDTITWRDQNGNSHSHKVEGEIGRASCRE